MHFATFAVGVSVLVSARTLVHTREVLLGVVSGTTPASAESVSRVNELTAIANTTLLCALVLAAGAGLRLVAREGGVRSIGAFTLLVLVSIGVREASLAQSRLIASYSRESAPFTYGWYDEVETSTAGLAGALSDRWSWPILRLEDSTTPGDLEDALTALMTVDRNLTRLVVAVPQPTVPVDLEPLNGLARSRAPRVWTRLAPEGVTCRRHTRREGTTLEIDGTSPSDAAERMRGEPPCVTVTWRGRAPRDVFADLEEVSRRRYTGLLIVPGSR
ncbi:MAG: hypothetical protein U0228_05325 [Myxococcaceae bacterium]